MINLKRTFFSLLFILTISLLYGNNIQVSNISLTGQDPGNGFVLTEFDLSWENSWRLSVGPANYDAAWVFVKFRRNAGNWEHASINYVNGTAAGDGHTAPAGSVIQTTSDGVGCFIYRNADGSGPVNYSNVQLRWNYALDGVDVNDILDVQVFAIEMVYVPEGSFRLGSALFSDEANAFRSISIFFGFPYMVSSENAITVGTNFGNLYYSSDVGLGGDQLGPIPASFPKGFKAFYMMKYEVSQDQYVCFFNTLTEEQKVNRDPTDVFHKGTDSEVGRNGISYTTGDATTTSPARPMNYINWKDMTAYLDWAGLRPNTEMEYEKACRGPIDPKPSELAWGDSIAYDQTYVVLNDGTEQESMSNPGTGSGNIAFLSTMSGFGGPVRVGIFAASAVNKNRKETGGSYFGIMELSGNLYERLVSVGSPESRAFTGEHGDGSLNVDGSHNVINWQVEAGDGTFAFRGGSYINQKRFCRVSDRYDASNGFSGTNSRIGMRGGRTAE